MSDGVRLLRFLFTVPTSDYIEILDMMLNDNPIVRSRFALMAVALFLMPLFLVTICTAQNAKDYYTDGNIRAKRGQFDEAVKAYTTAITMDSNYADAYYNRGTAKVRLKQYESAIPDFDKTIKLRPDFARGYSNLGVACLEVQRFTDAVAALTHAIALDSGNASSYFMLAQARLGTGDHGGGCFDLRRAKELGDSRADRFLRQYCTDSTTLAMLGKPERVVVAWPLADGWTVRDTQETNGVSVVELARQGETLDDWKQLATMTTYRGLAAGTVEDHMNQLFAQAKQREVNASLTVLERDTNSVHPSIIFKIEVNAKEPESQVWQIIHGTNDLFMNFWAIHQASVTTQEAKKWTAVFKAAKIVSN